MNHTLYVPSSPKWKLPVKWKPNCWRSKLSVAALLVVRLVSVGKILSPLPGLGAAAEVPRRAAVRVGQGVAVDRDDDGRRVGAVHGDHVAAVGQEDVQVALALVGVAGLEQHQAHTQLGIVQVVGDAVLDLLA